MESIAAIYLISDLTAPISSNHQPLLSHPHPPPPPSQTPPMSSTNHHHHQHNYPHCHHDLNTAPTITQTTTSIIPTARLQASEDSLKYPGWALAMITVLIIIPTLPVPIGYVYSTLRSRGASRLRSQDAAVAGCVAIVGQDGHREMYTKCSSMERLDAALEEEEEEDEKQRGVAACSRVGFLSGRSEEHYQLLPQQAELEMEEEQEEDTVV